MGFRGVAAEALETIELLRGRSHKGIRLSYNLADNTLVAKMTRTVYELSHAFTISGLDHKVRVCMLGIRRMSG